MDAFSMMFLVGLAAGIGGTMAVMVLLGGFTR
jgi:hypothetical protein